MDRNQKNPQDLMISVFERLRFSDYQRAKCVYSSWQSASRLSVPTNQVPWLIIFPKNKTCLTLFNPEEDNKLYKTQALDVEFAKGGSCKATYGSWLLMQDPQLNHYILNLFTHDIISLPPMESQYGMRKVERNEKDQLIIFNQVTSTFYKYMKLRSPVFWIDDKSKDYIVICALDRWSVIYTRRGDNFWNQVPEISACTSMVYKDHKLYFTGFRNTFTIIDFFGHIPQLTFQCNSRILLLNQIVVTITGDVLMVEHDVGRPKLFCIFKIYSSFEKCERLESLGDETMLLDLGITVLTTKFKGLLRNSIYFGGNDCLTKEDLLIFNLETQKMEQLHKIDFDSSLCNGARWFVPSFTRT